MICTLRRSAPFSSRWVAKEWRRVWGEISFAIPAIFTRFLIPAGIQPRSQKVIETTDIMLQMVASGRGVAALPRWLVDEQGANFAVYPVKLGPEGIPKQIFLGYREADVDLDYLRAFITLALNYRLQVADVPAME